MESLKRNRSFSIVRISVLMGIVTCLLIAGGFSLAISASDPPFEAPVNLSNTPSRSLAPDIAAEGSNVYAVWITVGYFEVSPAPVAGIPAIYPDGYQLGRELGSDTGEIERHRAFYIFDRTLPVGFQRGQDLNVDKAILVERFIE